MHRSRIVTRRHSSLENRSTEGRIARDSSHGETRRTKAACLQNPGVSILIHWTRNGPWNQKQVYECFLRWIWDMVARGGRCPRGADDGEVDAWATGITGGRPEPRLPPRGTREYLSSLLSPLALLHSPIL